MVGLGDIADEGGEIEGFGGRSGGLGPAGSAGLRLPPGLGARAILASEVGVLRMSKRPTGRTGRVLAAAGLPPGLSMSKGAEQLELAGDLDVLLLLVAHLARELDHRALSAGERGHDVELGDIDGGDAGGGGETRKLPVQ